VALNARHSRCCPGYFSATSCERGDSIKLGRDRPWIPLGPRAHCHLHWLSHHLRHVGVAVGQCVARCWSSLFAKSGLSRERPPSILVRRTQPKSIRKGLGILLQRHTVTANESQILGELARPCHNLFLIWTRHDWRNKGLPNIRSSSVD
jgi:hypothetical protein